MKIGGFQKCKVDLYSSKGFRITACQSWCNSHNVKKVKEFTGGAKVVFTVRGQGPPRTDISNDNAD